MAAVMWVNTMSAVSMLETTASAASLACGGDELMTRELQH